MHLTNLDNRSQEINARQTTGEKGGRDSKEFFRYKTRRTTRKTRGVGTTRILLTTCYTIRRSTLPNSEHGQPHADDTRKIPQFQFQISRAGAALTTDTPHQTRTSVSKPVTVIDPRTTRLAHPKDSFTAWSQFFPHQESPNIMGPILPLYINIHRSKDSHLYLP